MSTSSYAPIPHGGKLKRQYHRHFLNSLTLFYRSSTAILAGNDVDGSPIYVGKAYHEGDLIPAKVIPSKNVAYVSHNGAEHPKQQYEVLCNGNVSWVPSGHGQYLHNAVVGGNTASGEPLYIGRVHHMGSLTPGKIHPSHQSLYIPFNGGEVPFKNYEILTEN